MTAPRKPTAHEAEELPYVDDRVSKVWVALIIAVFAAIMLYGLLLGRGGLLVGSSPEPTPTPELSPSPQVSPSPDLSPSPGLSPSPAVSPSPAGGPSPTAAAEPS
jgi:hypothetical protein